MPELQPDSLASITPLNAASISPAESGTRTPSSSERLGAGQLNPAGRDWSITSHPLVQLTLARYREFVREPEAVFWVFVFPVLLAFALGIAFRNSAPDKVRIAIDSGPAAHSDASLSRVTAALSDSTSGVDPVVMSSWEAAAALRTGKVAMIMRPATGDNSAGAGKSAEPAFEYQFDPTRPESRIARLTVDDAVERALGRPDVATAHDVPVTEPGARYIDFLIPGLIGMNLMGSGMWGLGFAVVQARTKKLLKRFAATPMRRSHYLLSFMLSRLTFLTAEVLAVILFAWAVFGVKVNGSIISFAIVAVIGALMFAGVGLLTASRPRTIEGVSGLMNLVMLPMWVLSGTFFSASRFPAFMQPVIKVLPLTALNESLRAVMNDGAPISASRTAIAIMLAWGLVSFGIALKLFRWQ